MRLKNVKIKNFRSIESLDFDFTNTYKVLVGKNESGKSNILKALSLLDEVKEISTDDIREPLPNEASVTESYVRFIFEPSENELSEIVSSCEKNIIPRDSKRNIFIKDDVHFNIEKLIKENNQLLYIVEIHKEKRYYTTWDIKGKYQFIDGIKKPSNYIRPNDDTKPSEFLINNYFLIDTAGTTNTNITYSDVSVEEFYEDVVAKYLKALLKEQHPKVLFWEYDEKSLLPSTISMDSFTADPSICLPLSNLFNLAGITDISSEIKKAKDGAANTLRNLLNRVAEQGTIHFRDVWREHKTISFYLTPNGNNIDAGIKELNTYTCKQRSDGFKRFVTFLLMLSTTNKNKNLKNALILVDEPDISIHPSGIRDLRDELIKISKNNLVVATTHSIFLIDSTILENHFIVIKEKEKTSIKESTEITICEEEVLYRALGYSIYESFKEKNILFEGWRDKKLFKTAVQKPPAKFKQIKELIKGIGLSHSLGVKQIRFLAPMFELANRHVIICSDDDAIAKEKQKEFNKEKINGEWYRYSEILESTNAVTGEDFIKPELLKKGIKYIANNFQLDESLFTFERKEHDFIKHVDTWISIKISNKNERKELVDKFKDYVFENLTSTMIKEDYFEYCENLIKKVNRSY
jgi:predicted ATP-dependent endonuclease of OLD family